MYRLLSPPDAALTRLDMERRSLTTVAGIGHISLDTYWIIHRSDSSQILGTRNSQEIMGFLHCSWEGNLSKFRKIGRSLNQSSAATPPKFVAPAG